jgi:hypothetical protein
MKCDHHSTVITVQMLTVTDQERCISEKIAIIYVALTVVLKGRKGSER